MIFRSFLCSYTRSFVPSFFRSFVHPLIFSSLFSSFIPMFLHMFLPSLVCSFVSSFIHSFVRMFVPLFVPLLVLFSYSLNISPSVFFRFFIFLLRHLITNILFSRYLQVQIVNLACNNGHVGCLGNATKLFKDWMENDTP